MHIPCFTNIPCVTTDQKVLGPEKPNGAISTKTIGKPKKEKINTFRKSYLMNNILNIIWDHQFSMNTKFSEKLTFLTP